MLGEVPMTRRGGWPQTGFGERLRELREGAGLTQQQLGDRAGCHTMTIAKLEAATQEPAWPLVLALAQALGVGPNAFLQEPSSSPEPRRGRPRKVLPHEGGDEEKPQARRPRGRPPKAK
jgi:transcriptional regulator with XRE-family HTH domain